jgi:uncharacterized membrane protein
MNTADEIVDEYLKELNEALREIPVAGRRELLRDIGEHIAAARAERGTESEAAVREILERLGDPAEIAADARERIGAVPRTSSWREVGALILLPLGGVILPFVGWFAGVFLLWLSDRWTRRDKVIGTLILPGGLLFPVFALIVGVSAESCGGPVGEGVLRCEQSHTSTALVVGLIALVALPLVTDAYLARRLRGS